MKRVILLSLIVFLFTNFVAAQEKEKNPKLGLTASYQDANFDILFNVWLNKRIKLSPAFGLIHSSGGGSDFTLGLVPQFYMREGKVRPYFTPRFAAIISSPNQGKSTTDLLFGGAFGSEYFFTKNFSVSIEAQLNVIKSDENSMRFQNPGGTNVNTATAFLATIYF